MSELVAFLDRQWWQLPTKQLFIKRLIGFVLRHFSWCPSDSRAGPEGFGPVFCAP